MFALTANSFRFASDQRRDMISLGHQVLRKPQNRGRISHHRLRSDRSFGATCAAQQAAQKRCLLGMGRCILAHLRYASGVTLRPHSCTNRKNPAAFCSHGLQAHLNAKQLSQQPHGASACRVLANLKITTTSAGKVAKLEQAFCARMRIAGSARKGT